MTITGTDDRNLNQNHLLNQSLTVRKMTPRSDDFVDALNGTGAYSGEDPYCSDVTFAIDVEVDLIGKNCKFLGNDYFNWDSGTTFYTVIDLKFIEEYIQFGTATDTSIDDGFSEDTRHEGTDYWSRYYKEE